MLEYFVLRGLCTALGNHARAKGYTAFGYQAMLVALWFTGEISGLILGFAVSWMLDTQGDENLVAPVIAAYVTAAAGAGLSFLIVHLLPDHRDPNAVKMKDNWVDHEAFHHFDPRAADPKSKDVTTDPKEEARRQDERYSTE